MGWCPASLVVLFILSLTLLIMCASSKSSFFVDLRIGGRPAQDSESARSGGGLGSLAVVVIGVLPVGNLSPPGKGKE